MACRHAALDVEDDGILAHEIAAELGFVPGIVGSDLAQAALDGLRFLHEDGIRQKTRPRW